ncbi:hypothetical protein [Saccharothrix sp. S26]|nr:hypothetical protein [Saccharothrix sp. S26]
MTEGCSAAFVGAAVVAPAGAVLVAVTRRTADDKVAVESRPDASS